LRLGLSVAVFPIFISKAIPAFCLSCLSSYDYSLNIIDFARMIGKIGYCMGVAYYGLDNMDKEIVPSIMGEKDDIGRWVGSPKDSYISSDSGLHGLILEGSFDIETFEGSASCRVGLLSCFGTPEYNVCLGKIKKERFKSLWDNEILDGSK
jgi:hypothetical protein